MVAFEVSVNEKIVYTIGVGDRGLLTTEVRWVHVDQKTGGSLERHSITGRGLAGNEGGHTHWPHVVIRKGDTVTVRVIDADIVTAGSSSPDASDLS